MALVFTRENNLGVIRDTTTGELVVSSEKATLFTSNSIDIQIHLGSLSLNTTYSDIGTINGVAPTGIENAFFLIAQQIFIGNTICINV